MKKISYNPIDFDSNINLISLLRTLYASNEDFDFFLEEYKKAYDFCTTSEHINFYPLAFFQGEKLIAHIALVIDDRLPKYEAFFGFFEIIDDMTVFEDVWQEFTELARKYNIQVLKGPVNGSIWHQYRCVKEDSPVPFFKTEPMTPLYYYDFLSQVNPVSEITYSSGIRESYTDILKVLKNHKKNIQNQFDKYSFKIHVVEKVTTDVLLAIAQISAKVFNKRSWGYTKLDDNEFASLYDLSKLNEYIYKLFLLYHKKNIIGYCSTMKERRNLICKTICIAPAFQGVGLGSALALKIHEEAELNGIEKIMYVLVRDGNQVHNYSTKDVKMFRKYAVFDYKIMT